MHLQCTFNIHISPHQCLSQLSLTQTRTLQYQCSNAHLILTQMPSFLQPYSFFIICYISILTTAISTNLDPDSNQVKQDAQAVSRNCARAQDAAATKGAPLRELSVTKPAIPPPQPSMGASQLWGPPLRPSVNPSMPRPCRVILLKAQS